MALLVAALTVAAGPASGTRRTSIQPQEVFVLAGESNMLGRGQPLSESSPSDPRLLLWRDGAWIEAGDPLGSPSDARNGIGPGMSFGLNLLESQPDTSIGLVMCAVNASSIARWRRGEKFYRDCINSTRAAGGTVAGILFMQGETDAKGRSASRSWGKRFRSVRTRFRAALGWDVPFLLGQIGQYDPAVYPYQQDIRDQQALAAALPHTTLVPTSDLPVGADGVHFTVDSYKTVGSRFAAAWLAASAGGSGGGGVQPTQVFVLAGQSNMLGRGEPLSSASPPDPHLELWRDGAWTEASDPLGPPEDPESGIGPGMTFGLTLLQLEPGTTIGLVMCAQGTTSITEWQPTSPVYQSCISATRAGGGPVAGILFLQGETDALAHKTAEAWGTGFQSVLTAFRADLGSNIPFVLGQIGEIDRDVYLGQQEVRDEQAAAAAANPDVPLVLTKDLPLKHDGVHFTVDSYKTIGVRFANAWWQATGH